MIPVITNYVDCPAYMRPTWECLGFLEQVIIVGSITGTYKAEILVLPPILPNEYMFQKFADKGKSKAEIFAWVSR